MRRGILKVWAASTAVLAVTALGTTTAVAAGSDWEPTGPNDPVSTKACGTTLTITDKVNEVESRTRKDNKGNTRTDYRGRYVVNVTADDGRKVVLDNSGPYSVFTYANGDSYVPVGAPALIYPFDQDERRVFERAGLPPVFYYTKGRLELLTKNGKERVVTKPKNPVSICKLLR